MASEKRHQSCGVRFDLLRAVADDATVVGATGACVSQGIRARRRMPEQTLTARVDNHEERLRLLEALPARVSGVELQIRQLRTEMGEQFWAIRQEIRDGGEETRRYMRVLHEEVLSRIAAVQEGRGLRPKR
jgi:hypothetical protein